MNARRYPIALLAALILAGSYPQVTRAQSDIVAQADTQYAETTEEGTTYKRLMSDADNLVERRKYEQAIHKYQAAARYRPDSAKAVAERMNDHLFGGIKYEMHQADLSEELRKKKKEIARLLADMKEYFFEEGSEENFSWAYSIKNKKFAVIDTAGQRYGDFLWEDPKGFWKGIAIAQSEDKYWLVCTQGRACDCEEQQKSESYNWLHSAVLSDSNVTDTFNYYGGIPDKAKEPVVSAFDAKGCKKNEVDRPDFVSRKPYRQQSVRIVKPLFDKEEHFSQQDSPVVNLKHERAFSEGLAWVKRDGQWGVINQQDSLIVKLEHISYVGSFSEGLAWVRKNSKKVINQVSLNVGLWGVINQQGKFVVDPKHDFDRARRFSSGLAWVQRAGRWGVINQQGSLVVNLKHEFDEVREFSSGLAWVQRAGLWGVIDTLGVEVVKLDHAFDEVEPFSEGLAWVQRAGLWGVIDTLGVEVVKLDHAFDRVERFSKELAWVERDGQWGVINQQGSLVVDPTNGYDEVRAFSEGLAWVKRDGQWGVINQRGSLVVNLELEFDRAGRFFEVLAWVRQDSTEYDFINQDSSVVVDINQDGIVVAPKYDFDRVGRAKGLSWVRQGSLWGVINQQGKFVVDPQYGFDRVGPFSEGLAWVYQDSTKKYGFINKNSLVVDPTNGYDDVRDFSEGLAWVKRDGQWGAINQQGKFVVDPTNGYDEVRDFSEGFALVKGEDQWSFINNQGDIVAEPFNIVKPQYDQIRDFSEGLAWVKRDSIEVNDQDSLVVGLWGVIDKHGLEVVDPMYLFDRVAPFFEGLAQVERNGKVGLINAAGEVVLSPEYDSLAYVGSRMYLTWQGNRKGFVAFAANGSDGAKTDTLRFLPCDYEQIGYGISADSGSNDSSSNLLLVKQKGKWGFMRWDKNRDSYDPIEARYDAVTPFHDKNDERVARVYVAEHNLMFYINDRGEMLVPPEPKQ